LAVDLTAILAEFAVSAFRVCQAADTLAGDDSQIAVHDPLCLPDGFSVVIGSGDFRVDPHLIWQAYQYGPLPRRLGRQ
jgi:hypothetical protein